jgi:DNA polymerase iota
MDVTDIIDYNASILNSSNLRDSFFCLSKMDPTLGFSFDATRLAGHAFSDASDDTLGKRRIRGCRDQHGVAATVH